MTEPASPLPALKPCPFCGGGAVFDRDEFGAWVECDKRVGYELACWRGPKRSTREAAASGWNSAPRLVDGLRPEAPAQPDAAETLAWLCRALTTLALRHGVTLPPFPRRPT